MSTFSNEVAAVTALRDGKSGTWSSINPEYVARMRYQNRFKTLHHSAGFSPLFHHKIELFLQNKNNFIPIIPSYPLTLDI